jgi:hypothetical protein
MLNLIPVVVFLLMQGVGAEGLTPRQQQALLGLAHRSQAVQDLGDRSGSWVQALGAAAAVQPRPAPLAGAAGPVSCDRATEGGPASDAARPRDGPVLF